LTIAVTVLAKLAVHRSARYILL